MRIAGLWPQEGKSSMATPSAEPAKCAHGGFGNMGGSLPRPHSQDSLLFLWKTQVFISPALSLELEMEAVHVLTLLFPA